MLLIVIILLILILAIVPSMQTSFVELQGAIGPAIEDTRSWLEKNVKESEVLLPIYESLTSFLSEQILSTSGSVGIFSLLIGYVQNIASELSAIFLGLVLGLYSLLFRRKITSILSKILSAILPNRLNTVAYKGVRRTYFYFMEYLAVRVISAIYLALLSFLLCLIFHIPFRSLIAILIFFFNLIPQFGGLLITIILPLAFLILGRAYALPLLLILLVLHGLHMFVVEPFFLRKRLRPNLGLTISLTLIFGAIFGFVGFLFAVPMYASIHAILQNTESKRLIKRGLPVGDDYYLRLTALPESSGFDEEEEGESSAAPTSHALSQDTEKQAL
jgi:predicted PurR-regulated permease PerM